MKRLVLLAFVTVTIFSSCRYMFAKRIHGNGNVRMETRSSTSFHSVYVSGSIDVYVRQDSMPGIKIETDENLQEYIQVENREGVLHIQPEKGFDVDPSGRIKVYVSSPFFEKFDASGACHIYSENKITSERRLQFDLSGACGVKMEINAPDVDAHLSGACDIQLSGETKNFKVEGSGSTGISSLGLLAENVIIGISGAGDAEVYASLKLDVDVSGSGSVKYKGGAAVSQHISGSGSVKKLDQ